MPTAPTSATTTTPGRRGTLDDFLAAGDIGALGYYTSAHMLDTVGLITPAASDYYPPPLGTA